ncbi:MAG: hypothetical protein RJA70_1299 [Pseudomonadota bacterium]|jgi:glycosyltransferase involved in cell wall biosynthesis
MTKLGIGLPVYNGERHLAAALESLLAQTFVDFEIVICDNASTDSTEGICRDFAARDPRIRYVRNLQNIGAAPNFNRAFELCRAPYFKWAAHDDVCQPDYTRVCVEALDADPGFVLGHSEIEIIDDCGAVVRAHDEDLRLAGHPRPSVRFRDLILSEHWCTDVFGVMRREVLAKTGLIGSFVGSDRTLLAELGLHGRFFRSERCLFQNRDHARRSVHATDLRSAERIAWFDPKVRPGIVTLPTVRTWTEYLASVGRVPMSPLEKLACLRALADWFPPNRWEVRADLSNATRQLTAWAAHRAGLQ